MALGACWWQWFVSDGGFTRDLCWIVALIYLTSSRGRTLVVESPARLVTGTVSRGKGAICQREGHHCCVPNAAIWALAFVYFGLNTVLRVSCAPEPDPSGLWRE